MTVTEWYKENLKKNAGRTNLLIQLTYAQYRGLGGSGRWPSVNSALAEMEKFGDPGLQFERFWEHYMKKAAIFAREHSWNKDAVMKAGGWRK